MVDCLDLERRARRKVGNNIRDGVILVEAFLGGANGYLRESPRSACSELRSALLERHSERTR